MLLNLPNLLILIRIALIPIIIYLLLSNDFYYGVIYALILFVVASFTDLLDGWLARHRDQITTFGKYADPIADKLLILATLLAFATLGQISSVWVWLIAFRELTIMILRAYAATKGIVMAAEITGKLKTISQMALVISLFVILQWDLGQLGQIVKHFLTLLAVGLTLYSGIEYAVKSRRLLNAHFI